MSRLTRGSAAAQSLDAQKKVLKDAEQRQHSIAKELASGRRALRQLQRREFTDKLLLFLGFGIFLLVNLYIVRKRLGSLSIGGLGLGFGGGGGGGDGDGEPLANASCEAGAEEAAATDVAA